jgi:hypothetical protein
MDDLGQTFDEIQEADTRPAEAADEAAEVAGFVTGLVAGLNVAIFTAGAVGLLTGLAAGFILGRRTQPPPPLWQRLRF